MGSAPQGESALEHLDCLVVLRSLPQHKGESVHVAGVSGG